MRMPSMTSLPLRESKLPDGSNPEGPAWPRRYALLLGVVLAAVLLLLLAKALSAERRAIDNMEPQARAVLFKETWQGFQTLCQPQVEAGLTARCREQAEFLLQFPECDDTCREQLTSYVRPTR